MPRNPRILVAVDLEANTDFALEKAITLASASPNMDLVVLHVFEPFVGFEFDALNGIDPKAKIEIVRQRAEAALGAFSKQHPGLRVPATEVNVTLGRPANEIVWVAAHYDVEAIVVASHSRRGFTRMLLGSVAEKVVRLAGCEVIVARPKNHDAKLKMVEIEPLCEECAKVREQSAGASLWCERHASHHFRAHTYSSSDRSDPPSAWGTMTGS
jgi:nucleotide-binding universal stress UspA family protein